MIVKKPRTAWKVVKKGMKSSYGDKTWKRGVWYDHKGELELCESGFHASNLCVDAIRYVTPGTICKVEYSGEVVEGGDKFVATHMRVVETYRFTKRMAIEFSVYCARLCLKNFEYYFPDDKRPRLAIEAAEAYLLSPTIKNKEAAQSAQSAAELAAWSARSVVESAAWSAAESAVWLAAWSAAQSAVWSAQSVVWSAQSAVWSAALSAQSAARDSAENKMEKKLLLIIGASK